MFGPWTLAIVPVTMCLHQSGHWIVLYCSNLGQTLSSFLFVILASLEQDESDNIIEMARRREGVLVH